MTNVKMMNAFRDVQIAMDFHKMAENGYLDEEFTMYGCVFLEKNQRQYLISNEEKEIVEFIHDALKNGIYPSPIQKIREVCHVPLGEKETIGNQVKIRLAQKMQREYPLEFLLEFEKLCQQTNSDAAFASLKSYVGALKNSFSAEKLSLAENLILLAYESKKLKNESYQALMHILERERRKMQDDIVEKNILSKTLHTVMYETSTGDIKYATNARIEWVEQKKNTLKSKGNIVSPIYSRVYWYNNQFRLDDVQELHKKNYQRALNKDYFIFVKEIYNYPAVLVQNKYSTACQEMVNYYGYLWQILV